MGPGFAYASDQSLLVLLGDEATLETHRRVANLLRLLQKEPVEGVLNLHPSYCSVLVRFDPVRREHDELAAALRSYLERVDPMPAPEPGTISIPVCYGGEPGPDLAEVASLQAMTPAQVVEAHASAVYVVHFLGFAPGFAYLGGLPPSLATPRLAVPRRRVPAGSVGIGGSQTGVYPLPTPGGWRLIGRTPLRMFDPEREPMSLLTIGDRVRFEPIPAEKWAVFERERA